MLPTSPPVLDDINSAAQHLARSERGRMVLEDISNLLIGPACGLDSRNQLAALLLLTQGLGPKPSSTRDAIQCALRPASIR